MTLRPLDARRVVLGFATLGAGAVLAAALLAGMLGLFVGLSWPHREPAGTPEFGINFSCNYAAFLLLEGPAAGAGSNLAADPDGKAEWCAATLGRLLEGLGAKHLRISVEWSQVEPREGQYDFRLVDALLAEAGRHGARVLLTVGVKGQRHPEFYIPEWVTARVHLGIDEVISGEPYLREQALSMVARVVQHASASAVVDAWGADNEPYVPSNRANGWTLSREFVQAEVATIRANDPAGRPVSINHGQHFVFDRRWADALADSDILAASLYPFRNYELFGWHMVVPILEIGPLAPNYAGQARAARAHGRQYWITEMQAEPWVDGDMRLVSPGNPSPNLTPGKFRRNVGYARRTGASRVYLWGAEWWLYQRERYGDSTWWDLGRVALAGQDGSQGEEAAPGG